MFNLFHLLTHPITISNTGQNPPPAAPTAAFTCQRRSFAKRKLVASRSLHLTPEGLQQATDEYGPIVGQIDEGPRATKGNVFRVRWLDQLPGGLALGHVRTEFSKGDMATFGV